jgi:hypothetical protein
MIKGLLFLATAMVCASAIFAELPAGQEDKLKIKFVGFYFENGSPLCWSMQGDTLLRIELFPDYERESLNRQTTHWHFRVDADSGTNLRISISKMLNEIYNGMASQEWWNNSHPISCYISYDRKQWIPVNTRLYNGRELLVSFIMKKSSVYIARLPVYSVSDLDDLESRYDGRNDFHVIRIGTTLEGRPLEMIRLGDETAPHSVMIRARAHPWEPGGNWVIEGLIAGFLDGKNASRQKTFCVYIMPMTAKDGVWRGMTRFNTAGMDPNRKWEKMSDPALCPEKYALEKFLENLVKKGLRPDLGIDIHNDDAGGISFSAHPGNDTLFLPEARRFEMLMRKYTCFSEKAEYPVEVPGQPAKFVLFEDGLLKRYGIESLVWELNANWIKSTGAMPVQEDWISTGEGLNDVFYEFFRNR